MAHRTSEWDVKKIMSTTLTETQISPYLNTASVIVDTYLSSESLAASLLREIEMWLTAHLATFTRDRSAIEETIDDAEIKYPANSLGKNLDATPYGQTAKALDPTGRLAAIGNTVAGSMEALELW